MALTLVKGNIIEDGGITSAKLVTGSVTSATIQDNTIANVKMTVNPADASTFNAGDVPTAQLGLAPATDTSTLQDDIALLGFKSAANGSLAKYNLVDQTVDAFEDASGIDTGSSTNETRDSSGKYVWGAESLPATATGGNSITTDGDYKVHTFTGNGNYVSNESQTIDYLVIAGGGGGGGRYGGGGGAGGFRLFESQIVAAGTYAIVVGAGGAGGVNTQEGAQGYASSFIGGSISSSSSGGGGGNRESGGAIPAGGSGGGGSYVHPAGVNPGIWPPGDGNAGGYTPVEGYGGGIGDGTGGGDYPAGGGGGAGAAGEDAGGQGNYSPSTPYKGGDGGVGRSTDISVSGTPVFYAGGGGGGVQSYPEPQLGAGVGGTGGGGAGGISNVSGGTATAATGNGSGGGGGGGSGAAGAAGSVGIVIVRRPVNYNSPLNLTLVSTATVAQSAPTKGDIVFTYTNGEGTAVINTNITAEISADDGSTWTAFTLVSQGTTGGHTILTSHDQTITSTITSPYNMRYRIKTLVQSASMQTRIQAVSLGWS